MITGEFTSICVKFNYYDWPNCENILILYVHLDLKLKSNHAVNEIPWDLFKKNVSGKNLHYS